MRRSPLHDLLARSGVSFAERFGIEVATAAADPATEYRRVRDTVGITDFSYAQVFRVPEQTGVDLLDGMVAGNVARVRYGRVLHTFAADSDGMLMADCCVANNDDELVVVCESIAGDAAMRGMFMAGAAAGAGVTDLNATHAVVGVDGFKAWAVMKELFGADVLGLPYLSIEVFQFEGERVRLLRAGKTSEFGYLLIVPVAAAGALFARALESAQRQGGGLCGAAVHDALRLEGRFFNVFAEGARVRDPLPLGLQWMIDFGKEQFTGRDAIHARRAAGVTRKVVGIADENGKAGLTPGLAVYDGTAKVGEVVAACHSWVLGCDVGLAMLPAEIAYSGLPFTAGAAGGPALKTVSMPPIMPRSLTVRLDEL